MFDVGADDNYVSFPTHYTVHACYWCVMTRWNGVILRAIVKDVVNFFIYGYRSRASLCVTAFKVIVVSYVFHIVICVVPFGPYDIGNLVC